MNVAPNSIGPDEQPGEGCHDHQAHPNGKLV